MKIDEYQAWTETYWNKTHSYREQMAHALLGLQTEAAEVSDIFVKSWFSPRIDVEKTIDYDHLQKELGDALYCLATVARLNGLSLRAIMLENVKKLEKRFG